MKIGTTDINNVYIGSTAVNTVYIGTTQIFPNASSLLLDTYSGAAAAYSTRKLRTAYSGSAIRVRRSSDNTEQDIGFSGNDLDTSALTTFCSGTDGFVVTWYDQSTTGKNVTQSTAANQPQIVSSGSVITKGSKPAVLFDGSNDYLQVTSLTKSNAAWFASCVYEMANTTGIKCIVDQDPVSSGGTRIGQIIRANGSDVQSIGFRSTTAVTDSAGATLSSNTRYIFTSVNTGTTIEVFSNGSGNGSTSMGGTQNNGTSNFTIGKLTDPGGSQYTDGYLQEVIYFDTDHSSNKTAIESNINTYWSVY